MYCCYSSNINVSPFWLIQFTAVQNYCVRLYFWFTTKQLFITGIILAKPTNNKHLNSQDEGQTSRRVKTCVKISLKSMPVVIIKSLIQKHSNTSRSGLESYTGTCLQSQHTSLSHLPWNHQHRPAHEFQMTLKLRTTGTKNHLMVSEGYEQPLQNQKLAPIAVHCYPVQLSNHVARNTWSTVAICRTEYLWPSNKKWLKVGMTVAAHQSIPEILNTTEISVIQLQGRTIFDMRTLFTVFFGTHLEK